MYGRELKFQRRDGGIPMHSLIASTGMETIPLAVLAEELDTTLVKQSFLMSVVGDHALEDTDSSSNP